MGWKKQKKSCYYYCLFLVPNICHGVLLMIDSIVLVHYTYVSSVYLFELVEIEKEVAASYRYDRMQAGRVHFKPQRKIEPIQSTRT